MATVLEKPTLTASLTEGSASTLTPAPAAPAARAQPEAPKPVSTQSLFVTPLLTYQYPDAAALNQYPDAATLNALLTAEARAIRDQSGGMTRSNQNGWHSETDLFQRKEPGLSALCAFIFRCLSDTIRRSTPRQEKPERLRLNCSGWININPRGGFNVPHVHPGNIWSGVYYVKVPNAPDSRSGAIEFLDPRTNVNAIGPISKFQAKHRLAPKEGQILIFPSYLVHWVYPNEQDEERITIAFNCLVAPVRDGPAQAKPAA